MKKKFVIYIYDSNVYEWQIELYFDFQTEYIKTQLNEIFQKQNKTYKLLHHLPIQA